MLGHTRMVEEEAELHNNLSVLFNIERGSFMEPVGDTMSWKCATNIQLSQFGRAAGLIAVYVYRVVKGDIPVAADGRLNGFL
jgi:hypothetical protein